MLVFGLVCDSECKKVGLGNVQDGLTGRIGNMDPLQTHIRNYLFINLEMPTPKQETLDATSIAFTNAPPLLKLGTHN